MAHRKTSKRSKARTMLRLADLEQSKNAVLHSLGAASSQESYGHAIDELSRGIVPNHVLHLTGRRPPVPVLSRTEEPSAVYDQRAIGRRQAPAYEASDTGLL